MNHFFYPYHLIIALVTSVIFFIIILSYHLFLIRTTKVTPNTKLTTTGTTTENIQSRIMSQADTIALGALILSILTTGLIPIITNPLLDYSVDVPQNNTMLKIDIKNLGLAPAKHVVVSIIANNVNFSNFESIPFLANYFKVNTTILGKAFFEIDILPPRSETSVTAKLDISKASADEEIATYVRSDERVGFHDTIIASIFYLGLGVVYVMLFIYLVYWEQLSGKDKLKKKNYQYLNQRNRGSLLRTLP
ncbi:MAG TPA: hypothetical protein VE573_14205 [Nitrososphaeraceae archaeon]|nr:hypothetical protein [Nitrososphaeraceae archaeon]